MTIARLLASMALATMLAMPAPAQTIEDAAAAYQRGDLAGGLTQYRRLAEQGLAEAQFILGFMYTKGEGVPEDDAEAVRWYRLAAEQGHTRAQLYLGAMYASGEGVPEDAVYAYAWLSIAAAQGNTDAKEGKELVAKLMTQVQITEAQKRSRKYWTRYVVPFQ